MTTTDKGFDEILRKLAELRQGIEKGMEQAVLKVGRDYLERTRARLYELADEYEGSAPPYVAETLREMAEKVKLEVVKDEDGYHAAVGWEEGEPEGAEHILFGNREILPIDIFDEDEEELSASFEEKLQNCIQGYIK